MGKKGTQVPFDPSPTRSRTLRDIELGVVIARDCYVKESDQGCAGQRGRPVFDLIIECPTICKQESKAAHSTQLFQDPILGVWIAPKVDRLEEPKVKLKKSKR